MENNLPSILGGMAQGFTDFGKGLFDMFGTGGASVLDLIESAKTGNVTNRRQDDFRKWLYQTDSTKDAAAKGLGTALNGVQTVADYIPGVNALTQTTLGNAAQGALGGLADELKTYGEDYDLGRAGQRAAISAAGAAVSGGLADALKGSNNALLSSNTVRGLARGATGGAISGGGYAAIDGGDVLEAAKQGAGMGALIGGATGAFQDFKPAKTYDMGLTDAERASRLKEVRKMRNAIGSEKAYMSGALDEASENRWSELYNLEQAYKNGFDNYNDYHNTLRPTKGLDDETLGLVLKNMEEPELQPWMQKGSHQPTFDPTMSSLASSMDRTVSGDSFMPDDFYQHMDWYGGGDTKPYLESASAIQKIRGNPNAKVTMYRATVGDKIYPNDWVTLSPEYARQHLANALRDQPDAKIIKQTVAARDLRWPGDDINEFGYYPITNGDIARVKALETTLADADMAVNNPRYLTDENGNPRTFYHGSPNKNITEFDINQAGKNTSSGEHALYFTDSPEVADEFSYERLPSDSMFVDNRGAKGRVYPVNLEMNNPLDLDNLTDAQIRELWQYASPLGQLDGQEKFIKNLTEFRDAAHNGQLTKTLLDLDKLANSPYDGFTARMYPNQDNQAREYAVFDNSKVKMLEDVLANDDMAVNSAKIAPGQLGLFDDMPTQTPKTGTRQTSLFDQPDNPYLDYYSGDIDTMPLTPEAPVISGPVDMSIEDLTKIAIDESTLPKGWKKAQELANMGKRAKQIVLDPNDPNRARNEYNVALYSDAQYGRNMPVADVIDKLGQIQYGREIDRGAARLLADQLDESGDEFAKKFVTGAAEAGGNISHYRDAPKAKLADEQLSNLLNIGRSSSMLSDSLASPSARNARGDQWKGTINLDGKSIAKGSDGGISTFGHERLHAFQDAGNMGYDQRVVDAYNELHDDLSKIYHSDSQIRKDYGSDVKYWSKPIEQEARMAQFYLEDKFGVKGAQRVPERDANGKAIRYKDDGTIADPNNLLDYYTGKPAYKGEFEGDRKAINAAFDKFRSKLQDLTRKGVALPAFLTLLGGGAYMASQENDKEKEVK